MTTLSIKSSAASGELQKLKTKYHYYPEISHALGSVNAGILLSYLIKVREVNDADIWLSSKVAAVRSITGLSRVQQKTAIKVLSRHSLIETKRAGLPSIRHFKLNARKLTEFLMGSNEKEAES